MTNKRVTAISFYPSLKGQRLFQVENTKNWLQDRRARRVKQGKVSVRNAHWRLEVAP